MSITSPLSSKKILTAFFTNPIQAEEVYNSLLAHNYTKNDITIIMSDQTRNKYFSGTDIGTKTTEKISSDMDIGTKTTEGLGTGSVIGGMIGALAAAVAAIGTSLLIPGLGLVIAGPIAAGLAGGGAGAMAGGLAGALIGAGLPDQRAKEYEDAIKAGGILIGVHPHSDQEYSLLENEWRKYNNNAVKHPL